MFHLLNRMHSPGLVKSAVIISTMALEEELVRTLTDLGDPAHWDRADEVAQSLLRRKGDRDTQTRRGDLVRRLRAVVEGAK